MNKFELFCMIFFALDADWDETKDSTIGEYLSSANPFLFEDTGSADPAVFDQFCNNVPDNIVVCLNENSFYATDCIGENMEYVSSIINKIHK